ncbi:MAG: Flp pilus assembly protein CpaB [Acidimicrobiales bacterium]
MRPKPPVHRPLGAGRPRIGLLLRREPRLWWLVVLASAAATGFAVSHVLGTAEAIRRAWGTTEAVLVVRHDVPAGSTLSALDVELADFPVGLAPPGALAELPEDAVARVDLTAGEPLLPRRLAGHDLSPLAAALPPDTRAVAIPTEPGTAPPLVAGDRVDVLLVVAAEMAGDGPPGFAIATDALVVAVDEHAVTVAVERDEAPRVAAALGVGAVTLALVGE